jgi:hypothetical protein
MLNAVQEKACTKCSRMLPATSEFFVRCSARDHKDGLFTMCKLCRSGIVNEHNRRRRDKKIAAAGRVPGTCDACGTSLTSGRGKSAGHFDHNHATDEFRGWLCNRCNIALGCAGDNPEILRRLAEYLDERGFAVTRIAGKQTGEG